MYFQLKKDLFQSLQCFYSSVFMKVGVLPLFRVLLLSTFQMFWVWIFLAIDVNKHKLKSTQCQRDFILEALFLGCRPEPLKGPNFQNILKIKSL